MGVCVCLCGVFVIWVCIINNNIFNSVLAIAEASRESYPDDEQSLSGSLLSLAHSNSSTSFPPGSL